MTSDDMAARATDAELAEMGATAKVGRCMRLSPSLFSEHRASCVLPWGHQGAHTDGTAHWSLVIDGEPVECPDPSAHTQPDVAPSPDVDAGGAGLDVYDVAARVWQRRVVALGHKSADARRLADLPDWRAAIDAARAPLLADTDRLANWILNHEPSAIDGSSADVGAVAVAIRIMEAAQVGRRREAALLENIEAARAEIERLTGELDEAKAKTEGGEWTWFYGFTRPKGGAFVHHGDESQARALAKVVGQPIMRQRVWLGPVEPVIDGEAAP